MKLIHASPDFWLSSDCFLSDETIVTPPTLISGCCLTTPGLNRPYLIFVHLLETAFICTLRHFFTISIWYLSTGHHFQLWMNSAEGLSVHFICLSEQLWCKSINHCLASLAKLSQILKQTVGNFINNNILETKYHRNIVIDISQISYCCTVKSKIRVTIYFQHFLVSVDVCHMDQISKRGFNTFHGPFAPLSRTKHGTCILWKQPAVFDLKSYILNKSLWPWVNKDELASNRCFQNSTAAVLSPACLNPVERIMPGMVDPTNMSKMPMFIWKQGPTCFFLFTKKCVCCSPIQ